MFNSLLVFASGHQRKNVIGFFEILLQLAAPKLTHFNLHHNSDKRGKKEERLYLSRFITLMRSSESRHIFWGGSVVMGGIAIADA